MQKKDGSPMCDNLDFHWPLVGYSKDRQDTEKGMAMWLVWWGLLEAFWQELDRAAAPCLSFKVSGRLLRSWVLQGDMVKFVSIHRHRSDARCSFFFFWLPGVPPTLSVQPPLCYHSCAVCFCICYFCPVMNKMLEGNN